jgi:hypothetical protein
VITITNACITYFSIAHCLVRIVAAEKRNSASQFELSLTNEKSVMQVTAPLARRRENVRVSLDLLIVVGI